jgi:hypothetical protein
MAENVSAIGCESINDFPDIGNQLIIRLYKAGSSTTAAVTAQIECNGVNSSLRKEPSDVNIAARLLAQTMDDY